MRSALIFEEIQAYRMFRVWRDVCQGPSGFRLHSWTRVSGFPETDRGLSGRVQELKRSTLQQIVVLGKRLVEQSY